MHNAFPNIYLHSPSNSDDELLLFFLQVEGMEIAIALIGPQPKLTAGDYSDLIKQIRTLVSHSHIQVCCTALKLIGALAQGLRRRFAPHARGVLCATIGKLPDKKCHKAASNALRTVYDSACLTLDFVIDDVISGVDSKKVGRVCVPALSLFTCCGHLIDPVYFTVIKF